VVARPPTKVVQGLSMDQNYVATATVSLGKKMT